MATLTGGQVVWIFDADTGNFNRALLEAEKTAKKTSDQVDKSFKNSISDTLSKASSTINNVADSLGKVIKLGVAVGVTGGAGMMAMANAAFEQVKAVQNAAFGLKAYEKDADAVTKTLGDLVKYANSDMGVLFQRQELFKAATNLKVFGVETNKLVDYTKILSKGVALGYTSFEELSFILGRTVSQGKLTGDAFDQLIARGIKLPDSMRGAKVSAEELFEALDKSLPDDILEGRASTIEGQMIRLQSAFRSLGAAILGVNDDADGFVNGSLGDRFLNLLQDLRTALKDPNLVNGFKNMGNQIADLAGAMIPRLISALTWLGNNFDKVISAIKILVITWASLKILATGISIFKTVSDAITITIKIMTTLGTVMSKVLPAAAQTLSRSIMGIPVFGWIIAAIAAVIAIVVILESKFKLFSNMFKAVADGAKPLIDMFKLYLMPILQAVGNYIAGTFKSAFESIKNSFNTIFTALKPLIPVLKTVAMILGGTLVAAIMSVVVPITLLIVGISTIVGWIAQLIAGIVSVYAKIYEWGMSLSFVKGIIDGFNSTIGVFFEVMNATNQVKDATDKYKTAQQQLRDAIENSTNAQRNLTGAELDAEGATLQVERAQRTYNDAVKTYGVDSLEAKEAAHQLKVSQESQKETQEKLKEAQDKANKTQKELTESKKNAKKAADDMKEANEKAQKSMSNWDTLKSKIKGAFSGAGSWLSSAGQNIMSGLKSGIESKFASIQGVLGKLTSKLPSWKGPKSVDLKLLKPNAGYIMDGFIQGVENNFKNVKNVFNQLTHNIPEYASGGSVGIDYDVSSLDTDGSTEMNQGASSNGVTINQTNTIYTELDMNLVNRNLTWELGRA